MADYIEITVKFVAIFFWVALILLQFGGAFHCFYMVVQEFIRPGALLVTILINVFGFMACLILGFVLMLMPLFDIIRGT